MDFVGEGGLPVGLVQGARWNQITLTLQPGDRLLLYSDGFTETPLASGAMLDEAGLKALVAEAAPSASGPEFLDDLHWRLVSRIGEGAQIPDDLSAALFEFRCG
jgi:Serine phosphatase RsbU, regulator of sigma subunit